MIITKVETDLFPHLKKKKKEDKALGEIHCVKSKSEKEL